MALQLHMHHFHMPYLQRYITLKKNLATTEHNVREVWGASVKHDYASYLHFEICQGKQSLDLTRKRKALRKPPLYMSGVLVITRIIYFALRCI